MPAKNNSNQRNGSDDKFVDNRSFVEGFDVRNREGRNSENVNSERDLGQEPNNLIARLPTVFSGPNGRRFIFGFFVAVTALIYLQQFYGTGNVLAMHGSNGTSIDGNQHNINTLMIFMGTLEGQLRGTFTPDNVTAMYNIARDGGIIPHTLGVFERPFTMAPRYGQRNSNNTQLLSVVTDLVSHSEIRQLLDRIFHTDARHMMTNAIHMGNIINNGRFFTDREGLTFLLFLERVRNQIESLEPVRAARAVGPPSQNNSAGSSTSSSRKRRLADLSSPSDDSERGNSTVQSPSSSGERGRGRGRGRETDAEKAPRRISLRVKRANASDKSLNTSYDSDRTNHSNTNVTSHVKGGNATSPANNSTPRPRGRGFGNVRGEGVERLASGHTTPGTTKRGKIQPESDGAQSKPSVEKQVRRSPRRLDSSKSRDAETRKSSSSPRRFEDSEVILLDTPEPSPEVKGAQDDSVGGDDATSSHLGAATKQSSQSDTPANATSHPIAAAAKIGIHANATPSSNADADRLNRTDTGSGKASHSNATVQTTNTAIAEPSAASRSNATSNATAKPANTTTAKPRAGSRSHATDDHPPKASAESSATSRPHTTASWTNTTERRANDDKIPTIQTLRLSLKNMRSMNPRERYNDRNPRGIEYSQLMRMTPRERLNLGRIIGLYVHQPMPDGSSQILGRIHRIGGLNALVMAPLLRDARGGMRGLFNLDPGCFQGETAGAHRISHSWDSDCTDCGIHRGCIICNSGARKGRTDIFVAICDWCLTAIRTVMPNRNIGVCDNEFALCPHSRCMNMLGLDFSFLRYRRQVGSFELTIRCTECTNRIRRSDRTAASGPHHGDPEFHEIIASDIERREEDSRVYLQNLLNANRRIFDAVPSNDPLDFRHPSLISAEREAAAAEAAAVLEAALAEAAASAEAMAGPAAATAVSGAGVEPVGRTITMTVEDAIRADAMNAKANVDAHIGTLNGTISILDAGRQRAMSRSQEVRIDTVISNTTADESQAAEGQTSNDSAARNTTNSASQEANGTVVGGNETMPDGNEIVSGGTVVNTTSKIGTGTSPMAISPNSTNQVPTAVTQAAASSSPMDIATSARSSPILPVSASAGKENSTAGSMNLSVKPIQLFNTPIVVVGQGTPGEEGQTEADNSSGTEVLSWGCPRQEPMENPDNQLGDPDIIEQMEEENEELLGPVTAAKQELEKVIDEYNRKIRVLQVGFQALSNLIIETDQAIVSATERVSFLANDIDRIREELDKLQHELDAIPNPLNSSQAGSAPQSQDGVSEINENTQQLEIRVRSSQRDVMESKIKTLKNQVVVHEAEIESIQSDIECYQAKRDTLVEKRDGNRKAFNAIPPCDSDKRVILARSRLELAEKEANAKKLDKRMSERSKAKAAAAAKAEAEKAAAEKAEAERVAAEKAKAERVAAEKAAAEKAKAENAARVAAGFRAEVVLTIREIDDIALELEREIRAERRAINAYLIPRLDVLADQHFRHIHEFDLLLQSAVNHIRDEANFRFENTPDVNPDMDPTEVINRYMVYLSPVNNNGFLMVDFFTRFVEMLLCILNGWRHSELTPSNHNNLLTGAPSTTGLLDDVPSEEREEIVRDRDLREYRSRHFPTDFEFGCQHVDLAEFRESIESDTQTAQEIDVRDTREVVSEFRRRIMRDHERLDSGPAVTDSAGASSNDDSEVQTAGGVSASTDTNTHTQAAGVSVPPDSGAKAQVDGGADASSDTNVQTQADGGADASSDTNTQTRAADGEGATTSIDTPAQAVTGVGGASAQVTPTTGNVTGARVTLSVRARPRLGRSQSPSGSCGESSKDPSSRT